MKLSTRQDIEAPIEAVFAAVTDFDGFERQGLRRGAEISREDPPEGAGLGSKWQVRAPFRGKIRDFSISVTRYEAPIGLAVDSLTRGMTGLIEAELVALSPRRTRLQFSIDLRPNSLSGRVLVQSLKFAKSTLMTRMNARAVQFAHAVEERHRKR